jgi:hypothetical protein
VLALGAGLMYYLDPARGRARRALVRDRFISLGHDIDRAIGVVGRDLGNRVRGLWFDAQRLPARFLGEEVADPVLVARVRSKMGRCVSHPRAIGVSAHRGRVFLSGPILEAEAHRLLAAVATVPGVVGIDNHLNIHDDAGDISALQGGSTRTGERPEIWQDRWSPTARLIAGTAGGFLLYRGTRRGGALGLALGGLGRSGRRRPTGQVPGPGRSHAPRIRHRQEDEP